MIKIQKADSCKNGSKFGNYRECTIEILRKLELVKINEMAGTEYMKLLFLY